MIPKLAAINPRWYLVHACPIGAVLTKGRKEGESRAVVVAAAAIQDSPDGLRPRVILGVRQPRCCEEM